jgi:hypothetical protein
MERRLANTMNNGLVTKGNVRRSNPQSLSSKKDAQFNFKNVLLLERHFASDTAHLNLWLLARSKL